MLKEHLSLIQARSTKIVYFLKLTIFFSLSEVAVYLLNLFFKLFNQLLQWLELKINVLIHDMKGRRELLCY